MEDEAEFAKLCIEDRCLHKNWKARQSGYDDAAKVFQELTNDKSPEFNKYLGLVKKFVVDSNVVAQEKGLTAVLAFVENAALAGKTCGEIMPGIVTKCLGAPKAKTKELAFAIILMYIEIEKQEIVQDELLKGLDNKTPKIVCSCIQAIREALKCFGPKVITIKPIMKTLPRLLEDRDKTIREEAKQLVVEVYRWINDSVKPLLQTLKPIQVTELETEFAKVSGGKPVQTRFLRSEQQKKQALAASADDDDADENDGGAEKTGGAIDPYELIDAVEILSKIPKDFYERCEAKKWLERKEVLEELEKLTSNPKLESGDYAELVKTLKKMLTKDTNVLVVTLAAKCLRGLAAGLQRKFQPYAVACLVGVLEKFKEKKQNVVQALREAGDAIYKTTSLEAILEDIQSALDNKNPQIKLETASLLSRCFTWCTPLILSKKLLKPLCTSLTKTLNDTDPTVRDNSAEALGTALKVVGERNILPFIQDVDNLKMTKIKECAEKAIITAPQVTKAAKYQSAKLTDHAKVPNRVKSASVQKTATLEVPVKARPATASKVAAKSVIPKKPGKSPGLDIPKEPEFTERELSDEEMQLVLEDLMLADVSTGLSSLNWKDRFAAIEKFNETVQSLSGDTLPVQALVKLLARKPGFKENNFQVLKVKFDVLTYIVSNGQISKQTIDCCLSDLVEKVGDAKNGLGASSAITALAESTCLEYVTQEVLKIAFAQKNPKTHAEALVWLSNAIKEFGLQIQMKNVLDYLKKGLSSTNPTVRMGTVALIGVIYLYTGKSVRILFEEEKPAVLQLIDSEIAKLQDAKPPLPVRGPAHRMPITDSESENANAKIFNAADLLPRVDISDQITESLLTELEDKNWKVRAEALQKLSTIIGGAKCIAPNLADLPSALKSRLVDSNKNLALQALTICQALGTALGQLCSKHVRVIAPGLLSALGDNKSNVRAAAQSCLNCWVEQCGVPSLFEGEMIADAIKLENPALRIELLGWLSEKLPTVKSLPAAELNVCIPYLYACIEDRNPEVRKKAQECVLPFMIHLGYDPMMRACEKLKQCSKSAVFAQLEKARPNLPAKVSTKSKAIVAPQPQADMPAEDAQRVKLTKSSSKNKIAAKQSSNVPTAASAKASKKDDDVDCSPTLAVNNIKDQRMLDEKALKVLKWNFTTPREEFYTLLRDQMTTANWNRTLISHCFHNDFKFHLKALDMLFECLAGSLDATISNLDLVLKWLALRFFDTNPSVLMKGLEYLQQLCPALVANGYKMLDSEAQSFIPYLILKVGDPKDTVRKGVRDILHQICQLYPASKVFIQLMQGLSSKNARQRAECLEELGSMIELYGMGVCQPSPASALKEVARQIADRDNGVRNAALNCVVQAYCLDGEKVYKYVGNLSDKDMSLLEERIKRSTKIKGMTALKEPSASAVQVGKTSPQGGGQLEAVHEGFSRPNKRVAARPRSMGPLSLDVEEIENMFKSDTPQKKIPEPVEVNADEILNLPDIKLPQTRLRPSASAVKLVNSTDEASMALNLVLAQLASQEIAVVVEAFAQIEEVLKQEDKAEVIMSERVDQLLLMAALQYRLAHNKHMADDNICKADVMRLYRCVTMALMTLFDHKVLPRKASRDVLRDLIPHLVTVILDARLNELQDGAQIIRAINVVIMRILQKSNPTHVMSAVIKLLHDCVGNMSAAEKYTELIMKCLWKMMRMLNDIPDLNIDRILLDAHVFLKTYPSSYWRDKPVDTPIRTIKTLLYHLVKMKGEDITKHLTLIPNRNESDLVTYLQKLLNSRRSSSDQKMALENKEVESQKGPRKVKHSTGKFQKNAHDTLTEIFKKIGDKEQTSVGLNELYEFIQQHPEEVIEPYLQRSSEFFRNYITKGLHAIESEKKTLSHSAPEHSLHKVSYGINSTTITRKTTVIQDLPALPPVDASPLDSIEWLKAVAAHLNLNGSSFNDPEYVQKVLDSMKVLPTDDYRKDVEATTIMYNQIKEMFEKDMD